MKYTYWICYQPDRELFYRQCAALEKRIPGLKKERMLEDVDCSLIQIYEKDSQSLVVRNSEYIHALYIESEFDLREYFPNARTRP